MTDAQEMLVVADDARGDRRCSIAPMRSSPCWVGSARRRNRVEVFHPGRSSIAMRKPILIADIAGFWSSPLAPFAHMRFGGFIREDLPDVPSGGWKK